MGTNGNLLTLFKLPNVRRVGGDSSTATSGFRAAPGKQREQIAPSDVNALAAFVKAAGWQCFDRIKSGRSGSESLHRRSIVAATTKTARKTVRVTIDLPLSASSAALPEMTLRTCGHNISATSGFLSASGSLVTCYAPYYSAVLNQIP